MVDPRVIHVMLAEEEVRLSYYTSRYTLYVVFSALD